jgi:multisubunit Na+/H+ antiporter MnhC subunit
VKHSALKQSLLIITAIIIGVAATYAVAWFLVGGP